MSSKATAGAVKVRRTLALEEARKAELQLIRGATSATTDTAAVNDAIHFRAQLVDHDLREIKTALFVWHQLRLKIKDGGTVVVENRSQEPSRTELILMPTLG